MELLVECEAGDDFGRGAGRVDGADKGGEREGEDDGCYGQSGSLVLLSRRRTRDYRRSGWQRQEEDKCKTYKVETEPPIKKIHARILCTSPVSIAAAPPTNAAHAIDPPSQSLQ